MCAIGNWAGKSYCGFCCLFSCLQSPLLLFIRLMWGYLFFLAGWEKFTVIGIPAVAESFASLGIPLPYFTAAFVASVELVGGILLMVGFLSRLAALFLTITMIVAYVTAHQATFETLLTPSLLVAQSAWNYLVAALIVLAFGPGFFSLDHWWKKCCKKNCCCCGKSPCCCSKDHKGYCTKDHSCSCCGKTPCCCSKDKSCCIKEHICNCCGKSPCTCSSDHKANCPLHKKL